MISQDLTIPVDGGSMPAYLARPEDGSGAHPAVIVLQEIYGVNQEMRRITELLPSVGYVGLAINFYHRTHPNLNESYTDEGQRTGVDAARQVTREQLRADIAAAATWLTAQDFVKAGKVATWGFCFGGTAAFLSATMEGICGAIGFYGTGIMREWGAAQQEALADARSLRAPVLLIFGAEDPSTPKDQIERLDRTLRDAGAEYQIQIYPNVGHAFFRHGSPQAVASTTTTSDEAVAESVADAWGLAQAFFHRCFYNATPSKLPGGILYYKPTARAGVVS
jgi:carboxymethylenebutenolidase